MYKEITFDKFIRWTGVALLIVAVLWFINYLSNVLLPFFVAWLFAYLLYPVVKFVQKSMHIKWRAVAIVIAIIIVAGVAGTILWLIIPSMLEQFERLGEVISRWVHQTTHTNDLTTSISQWFEENQGQLEKIFRSKDFSDVLRTVMPKVFSILGHTANIITSIVASLITLLYMFFILLDYENLTTNWIKIFPKKHRPFWNDLAKDVEHELNNYIRGQVTVSTLMGVMFCIGFLFIEFPMPIGLGILIGILNLVPYLHTLAIIPTAFLAMLKASETGDNFWMVFGGALGVFCIVQLLCDLVVTPKIMGKAMRLNPAILLLSLSIWGSLLGFIGLIVALPLTTLIIAYWQHYVTKENEKKEYSPKEKQE